MNTGKTLRDDNAHVEEPRRHGRMFPAAPLPVILIADHNRTDALRLIPTCNLCNGKPRFARQYVRPLAGLAKKRIVRPQEHIVTDLIKMAAELEPWACRRDMIGRRLALGLDQQREFLEIFAVPAGEGLQEL